LTELFKNHQEIHSQLATLFAGDGDLGIPSKKEIEQAKTKKKSG
jgi:hypothetical protein